MVKVRVVSVGVVLGEIRCGNSTGQAHRKLPRGGLAIKMANEASQKLLAN